MRWERIETEIKPEMNHDDDFEADYQSFSEPSQTCPERTWQIYRRFINYLKSKWWLRPARRLFMLFLYFVVGMIVYCHYEEWSFITALSFIINTITTVGFGYNVPTTDGMRLFTVFYMVIGIYFVFSFISDFVNSNLNFAASLVKVKLKSQDLKADYQFNFRLMCLNMFAIVVTVMIGAVILCALEDWSFIAALYYAVETSTSVGYGDLEVQHELTHLFMCFYMLFSTLLFAFAFNNLQVLRAKRKQMHKMESMLMKRKELSFLLDLDKGPGVARDEFVLALLLHFGSIDYENDVLPWVEKFNELDKSGHGRIFREDLLYFSTEESANAAEEMRVFEGSNFLRFVEGLSSARPSERQSSLARASFADLRSTQVTNDSTTKSALHAIFEPHRQHSQSF